MCADGLAGGYGDRIGWDLSRQEQMEGFGFVWFGFGYEDGMLIGVWVVVRAN